MLHNACAALERQYEPMKYWSNTLQKTWNDSTYSKRRKRNFYHSLKLWWLFLWNKSREWLKFSLAINLLIVFFDWSITWAENLLKHKVTSSDWLPVFSNKDILKIFRSLSPSKEKQQMFPIQLLELCRACWALLLLKSVCVHFIPVKKQHVWKGARSVKTHAAEDSKALHHVVFVLSRRLHML